MKVEKWAWPGGYPLCYEVVSDDGHFVACPSCCNRNRIGKRVKRCQAWVNWEDDTLQCEVCEKHIESAYGRDNN